MARTIDRILLAIKKFSSEVDTTTTPNNIMAARESFFDTMSSLKVAIVDIPSNESAVDKVPLTKSAVREVPQSKPAVDKVAQSKPAVDKVAQSKPAVDKVAQSKPAVDKVAQSKPAVDKVAPSKLAVDNVAPSKLAVDNVAPSKPTVDKLAPSKTAVDKLAPSKTAVDKLAPSKPAVDKIPKSKPTMDKIPKSKPAMDKNPKSKPAIDKMDRSNTAVDKMAQSKPAVDKMVQSKPAVDKMAQSKPAVDKMAQSKPAVDKMAQSKPAVDKMAQSKPAVDKMAQSKPVVDKIPPSKTAVEKIQPSKPAMATMPPSKPAMATMPPSKPAMATMPPSKPAMATMLPFKTDLATVQRSKLAMAIIAKNKATVGSIPRSMSTSAVDSKLQSRSATNSVLNSGRERSLGSSPSAQDQLLPPLASLDGKLAHLGNNLTNKDSGREIVPVVMATEPSKKLYLGRYVVKKSKTVSLSTDKDALCQTSGRATSASESESPVSSASSANSSPRDSILSQQPYCFEKNQSDEENVSPPLCSKRTGCGSTEDGNEAKRRRLSDIPTNQQRAVGEQMKQSEDKLSPKFHHFKNLLRNLRVVKRRSAGRGQRCKLIPSQDMESELLNTARWAKDFTRRSYGYTCGFVDSHCRVDELVVCLNRDKAFHTDCFSLPVNVDGFIAAFTNPRTFAPKFPDDELLKFALSQDGVWVTLGCPPHKATYFYDAHERSLEEVVSSTARVVALGPCGLDHTIATLDWIQRFVFEAQVRVAAKLNIPLVIECREAEDDVIAILQKHLPNTQKIHLHGFTGDMILANRWLSHFPNVFFGLSPAIGDVSSSRSVKEMVASIPLNRILLESGASQTVPEDFKKVVSMAHFGFALFAAKAVGELRKLTTDAVLKACRDNTRQMYGI